MKRLGDTLFAANMPVSITPCKDACGLPEPSGALLRLLNRECIASGQLDSPKSVDRPTTKMFQRGLCIFMSWTLEGDPEKEQNTPLFLIQTLDPLFSEQPSSATLEERQQGFPNKVLGAFLRTPSSKVSRGGWGLLAAGPCVLVAHRKFLSRPQELDSNLAQFGLSSPWLLQGNQTEPCRLSGKDSK